MNFTKVFCRSWAWSKSTWKPSLAEELQGDPGLEAGKGPRALDGETALVHGVLADDIVRRVQQEMGGLAALLNRTIPTGVDSGE